MDLLGHVGVELQNRQDLAEPAGRDPHPVQRAGITRLHTL